MTEPAKNIRSHAEIWADLQAETALLKERDLQLFTSNIAPLYRQHSRAQSDVAEAQILLDKLRSFSQGGALGLMSKQDAESATPPASIPFTATTTETADTGEKAEVADTEEDSAETADTEEETEAEAPANNLPMLELGSAPNEPAWENKQAIGDGWLSQLAATLGDGDSLLFAVSRVGEKLRVVIQPKALKGETSTAVPLEALGLPSELDNTLVQDLMNYREGRGVARQMVSYLEQIKAKAEEAQKNAANKQKNASTTAATKAAAPKPPKPTTGKVVLTTIPAGAALVTFGSDGKKVELQSGVQRELPPGTYVSKASFPGHKSKEQRFDVKAGSEQVLELRLENEMASLFS